MRGFLGGVFLLGLFLGIAWAGQCSKELEKFKTEKIANMELKKVLDTLRMSLDQQINELYSIKNEIENLLEAKKTAEHRIEKLKEEIEALKKKIEELKKKKEKPVKKVSKEEELEKFARLAEYYSTMRASKAAKIFDTMPSQDVAKILLNMEPEVASKILGYMDPKKAAEVSEYMKEYQ